MTDNYLKNYRVLGVQPGVSWKQLRQAYKKMVNTWHPDRFQQDARQKKLAEEKTKEITQSYKELAEYYAKFGVLPLPVETEEPPVAAENPAPVVPAEGVVAGAESAEPAPATRSTGDIKPWITRHRARLIAALAAVGFFSYLWQFSPRDETGHAPIETGPAAQTDLPAAGREAEAAMPTTRYFTTGSSLGEVYAIQGVPTRTEHNIWYYGNSKIYFSAGKVTGWEESMDSPLRVSLVPGHATAENLYFGKGSTKAEVMAAQGTPDRDAGNVWEYGASQVYFEGDRVTEWREAPLYPLRIRP
ncbi:MAG: DnaJ domain-containing protein [Pseudomonadota bacterium]